MTEHDTGRKKKRVAIYTLGCKVNQYESAIFAGFFKQHGYELVDFNKPADIYIINTCTVTHLADRKSRQAIRRAVKINPEAKVVVAGCYAQIAPEKIADIPGVDLIIGTQDHQSILKIIENDAGNMVENCPGFAENYLPEYNGKTRAFIKIQEGCESFCSYCIIPYSRGPLRSRKLGYILSELKNIIDQGYREIVLTGIHAGEYGRDLPGDINLTRLVEGILKIPGLTRLRLSSLEPQDVSAGLIDIMAGSRILCPHLHLPLQNGDDEILRRMRRKYSTHDYAAIVESFYAKVHDAAVTTDVMVGFPGEKEKHFENTCRFVEQMGFSGLHVFKYSPRSGTPAAGFPDQVPAQIKELRSKRLLGLSRRLYQKYALKYIGREKEVLVEGFFDEKKNMYEGLTDNYLRVVFTGCGSELKGKLVKVRILEARESHLAGIII